MTNSHLVTFFAFDGIQALDLFGPLEAFASAQELKGECYNWQIASFNKQPIETESGTTILPDIDVLDVAQSGTLVLPGGIGARRIKFNKPQCERLRSVAENAERIAAVCTGSFIAAKLGIADDRSVATHWRHGDELASKFGSIQVDNNALFVKDGKLWSSAGITAGIDMVLAMIAEDHGSVLSTSVARQLVVYARRPGNQTQFSEPLVAETGATGRLSDVLVWIADNLSNQMSVEQLATKAGMSPRHFARQFKNSIGTTPAQYIEHLRLDKARMLLGEGRGLVHQIATAVGFSNPDSFRRAFERRFAVSPTLYRQQFGVPGD